MKKVYAILTLAAIVGLTLTGCFFTVRHRPPPISWEELQEKQRVTFNSSYDRVWDAALVALATQKIDEVDKESGIITTREMNVSASKISELAWSPNYSSFWYYESSDAMDNARYWINIKVSKIAEDTTKVQITPNFEIHIREHVWDTTSNYAWKRIRSKGVIEDIIAGRIARELGGD